MGLWCCMVECVCVSVMCYCGTNTLYLGQSVTKYWARPCTLLPCDCVCVCVMWPFAVCRLLPVWQPQFCMWRKERTWESQHGCSLKQVRTSQSACLICKPPSVVSASNTRKVSSSLHIWEVYFMLLSLWPFAFWLWPFTHLTIHLLTFHPFDLSPPPC